jgi:hypothetical protein
MRRVLGVLLVGWRQCWPAGPVACGSALVLLAVGTGLNRNLLYLSMLLSAYILWATSTRRNATVALGLGLLGVLSVIPVAVPDVEFVAFGNPYRRLQPGETVSFTFSLSDVRELARRWGPVRARIIVDGRGLSGLEVTVNGLPPVAVETLQKYGLEEMRVPFEPADARHVTVSLGVRGGRPRIYLGPEVRGDVAYPEAVFVEIGNERVAAVHHAGSRSLR